MANDHSAAYPGDTAAFTGGKYPSFTSDAEGRAWERSLYAIDTSRELAKLTGITDLTDRQSTREVLNLLWAKPDQGWDTSGFAPYSTVAGNPDKSADTRYTSRYESEEPRGANRHESTLARDINSREPRDSYRGSPQAGAHKSGNASSTGRTYRSTYGTTRTDASSSKTKTATSKKRRTALDSAWDIISGVMEVNSGYSFGDAGDAPKKAPSPTYKRLVEYGKKNTGWKIGRQNNANRSAGSQTAGNRAAAQGAAAANRSPARKSLVGRILLIIILIYIIAIMTIVFAASNLVHKHDLSPNEWIEEMEEDNTTGAIEEDQKEDLRAWLV